MEERIHEDLIKITHYELSSELPNPFVFNDGTRVESAADWARRREEIYESAVGIQYGDMPPKPEFLEVQPTYLPGRTGINSFRIVTGTRKCPISFTMSLRLPENYDPALPPPVVVAGDACFPYMFNKEYIDVFIKNGVALATFNRTELAPDLAVYLEENHKDLGAIPQLVHNCFEQVKETGRRVGQIYDTYPEYDFGTIAAWAWGYSRCVDALEILKLTDMECIAFTGHSRGAKTAILAGVVDTRAAIVNPNATCAGGCSCYRLYTKIICEDGVERESERGERLVKIFPYWMGSKLIECFERGEELPFDSHYLKAMVAPRVLFVSEAASDAWASPVGTWQTSEAAKEVYKLLGCEENLLWYYRRGTHYHEIEDIEQLVNVVRHVKYGEPLNDKYFKKPFGAVAPAFTWRAPQA